MTIEGMSFRVPSFGPNMDLSPSSVLLFGTIARISISIFINDLNVLYTSQANVLLFNACLGILLYQAIVEARLLPGVFAGLGVRIMFAHIVDGQRWSVISGLLLGIALSDGQCSLVPSFRGIDACLCSGDPLLGLCSRNDNDEEESETCSAPEQS